MAEISLSVKDVEKVGEEKYDYRDWKCFPECIIVNLNRLLLYNIMVDKIKSEIPDAVQTYFNKSSLHITPSTRMIVNIKQQLINMLPKAKRERAKGGKSYKRILACWETDWLKLMIYIHELDKPGAMKLL